jgi:hypothetical protein
MRRRPPWTVLAYVAVYAAVLVGAAVDSGAAAGLMVGGVLVGAGLIGLYLRVWIAWVLLSALGGGQLVVALLGAAPWWVVGILAAQVALLVSAPTREYVRRGAPRERGRAARIGRAVVVVSVVLAGLLAGLWGLAVALAPDPISGDLELVRSHRPGVRVLFVGNTLTSDHGMPEMVSDLADADRGGQPIFAVRYARRGSTLEDALDDHRLTDVLEDERWNFVVLQEHSQVASRLEERKERMGPAATALARMADRAGAKTVLFSSGAYEEGDRDADSGDTYQAMQNRLNHGYYRVAVRLPALLAPVGSAWGQALHRVPGIDLWAGDGRRPSKTGSYLTACVFYALLTDRDPAGNSFTAGLDRAEALRLQGLAWRAVRQTYL